MIYRRYINNVNVYYRSKCKIKVVVVVVVVLCREAHLF